MPSIPIRGVGGVGVISDINAQDAPEISWTDALNMRFSKGEMSRYSIFKYTDPSYSYSKVPVGVSSSWPSNVSGIVTVFSDGSIEERRNGVTRDMTPSGTLGSSNDQVSWTFLGSVKYLNREGDVPVYLADVDDTAYAPLPDWPVGNTCKVLRSYKDFLIALNVTKGTQEYQGMVKWSDATQNGAPPSNWNVSSDSSLAGETIINDIKGHIIDGMALGDSFMIYGQEQVYRMDYIGSPFIFNIAKAFDTFGAIAKNCVVAVDNKHYVFTQNDIVVHDGMQKLSLVNDKVSEKLFAELDYSLSDRCFVYHDRIESELVFCYPSTGVSKWSPYKTQGCNKAAVYNYISGTWTFIDLPALVASSEASMDIARTWADLSGWASGSNSWASLAGTRSKSLVVCSAWNLVEGIAASSYFVDRLIGGRLPNPPVTSLIWEAYAESENRDMDELIPTLMGRKQVNRIIPQYRIKDLTHSIQMTVGTSSTPTSSVIWGREKTFLGYDSPKYDLRSNARYISFKVRIPQGSHAELSGFDLDISLIAGR
jgi:hypothetical protein